MIWTKEAGRIRTNASLPISRAEGFILIKKHSLMKKTKLSEKMMMLFAFLFAAGMNVCAQKTAYAVHYGAGSTGQGTVIELNAEAGVEATASYSMGDAYPCTATEVEGKYYIQAYDADDNYLWGYYDFDNNTFMKTADISMSDELRDITYDAATGTIYGVKSSQIYTIDVTTGKATKFYNQGGAMLCGITSDGNGGFYVFSSIGAKLYHYSAAPAADNFTTTTLTLPDGFSSVQANSSLSIDAEGGLYMLMKSKNPSSGYSYSSTLCKINTETGAVTVIGEPSTSTAGIAVGLSFADFKGGSVTPEEPEVISRVKYEYLMGDAMGTSEEATKYTEYFYGPDNELLRALELSRDGESGAYTPYTYTKYVTTIDDSGNKTVTQSMRKKVAGGGSVSDLDRYWQKYDEIDVTVYNAEGKMVEYTKTGNTRTEYTYDGDNLVSEKSTYVTGGAFNGKIGSKVFYSDFVDGFVNCPQTVLVGAIPVEGSAANVTILEYKYDEAGRKTECVTYKTTGAVADDDGVYYKGAEKADPKQKETWEYDEAGRLTAYTTYKKYKNGEWVPDYNNKLKTYVYDNETTTIFSYSGSMSFDEWYRSPTYTKEVTAEFNGQSALQNFTVTANADKPGTYTLTADAPEVAVGDKTYNVYRDGEIVGEMTADAETGKMTFEEKVGNGIHDWFVQTYDNMADASMNISNAVEMDVNITLNPVSVIKVTRNEPVDDECQITVEWEAPETAGAEILGYNFYTDVVNIDKAVPLNTELLTERTFSKSWVNTNFKTEEDRTKEFWVEVVYDLGKVKSEKQIVVLNMESTGINGVNGETPNIDINGNVITVNSKCESITVNSLNGANVAKTNGNKLDLSGLSSGVYLVTVKAEGLSQTVKIVKK